MQVRAKLQRVAQSRGGLQLCILTSAKISDTSQAGIAENALDGLSGEVR